MRLDQLILVHLTVPISVIMPTFGISAVIINFSILQNDIVLTFCSSPYLMGSRSEDAICMFLSILVISNHLVTRLLQWGMSGIEM